MRKLILRTWFALGDTVQFTAAVRDLHRCHPGRFGSEWDLNTIKHVLENFAGFQSRVALLPPRAMNSSRESFQPGDFILHRGVMPNGWRARAFREAAPWIVK